MFVRPLVLSLLVTVLLTTASRSAPEVPAVVTVSAASFEQTPLAPDAIAAAFGSVLATTTASGGDIDPIAHGVQLPIEIGGTRVEINDRPAALLFVSPTQINFVIPTQTGPGQATIVVRAGDGTVSTGTLEMAPVASGVFTANSDGRGVAAALALRLRADNTTQYQQVAQFDSATNRFVAAPIDLGPQGERVFLVIFATGFRHSSDPNGDGNLSETVRVLLGGEQLTPIFAGGQGDFIGLDQINVELPRNLIGRGEISFAITSPGAAASNQATIAIAGPSGPAVPHVSGFNVSPALAGQTITISGSGFFSSPADNVVRINGVEAAVTSATGTELIIVVPFGAETGSVSVRTPLGEGTSAGPLLVRTSISGFVENTARQPLSGVNVKLVGTTITVQTSTEGSFVLPDVPSGTQYVDIDGESLPTTPPYPKVTLKTIAFANRDNQFARPVSLQQSTGGSASVGSGGSGLGEGAGGGAGTNAVHVGDQVQPVEPTPIQTLGFTLSLPVGVSALFPNGSKNGTLFLTHVHGGRTPVDLPTGVYSSGIVQVAPFDVQLNPGAKLTFPNTDGLPPNSLARLFRYDSSRGQFVEEPAGARVSADGQRVETAANAITRTSYYFAAIPRATASLTGRVLENDGVTPVRRAMVSLRGQETTTDGNGGYLLRQVPVKASELMVVEVAFQRPNGRVERAASGVIEVTQNSTIKVPDILLPGRAANRAPVILGPVKFTMDENQTVNLGVMVSDADVNPLLQVTLAGPAFASLVGPTLVASATSAAPGVTLRYSLRIAPGYRDAGTYTLVVTAIDQSGGRASTEIGLIVRNVNRAPVAANQTAGLDEDIPLQIGLAASDPDLDPVVVRLVTAPLHGAVSGNGRVVTYIPSRDYFGVDSFTYRVSDGTLESNTAAVTLTIRPINDAPLITVPSAQTAKEGQTLTFAVLASDVDDGQTVSITATGLPQGAKILAATATSAQFSWTPAAGQAGQYTLTFRATDSGSPQLSSTKQVVVTVVR